MTSKKVLMDLRKKIIDILKEKLPAELCYHNFEHTLDVMEATERIAIAENTNADDIEILITAAAFHDAGYIYAREDHENRSCIIATEMLSSNGVDKDVIDKVCDLILATKVPHNPQNKLDEILCDADLDYLGRDDYFPISKNVFQEFKTFGVVTNEKDWNELQVKFLESHKYFTRTSIDSRNQKKEEHLNKIKKLIS